MNNKFFKNVFPKSSTVQLVSFDSPKSLQLSVPGKILLYKTHCCEQNYLESNLKQVSRKQWDVRQLEGLSLDPNVPTKASTLANNITIMQQEAILQQFKIYVYARRNMYTT